MPDDVVLVGRNEGQCEHAAMFTLSPIAPDPLWSYGLHSV